MTTHLLRQNRLVCHSVSNGDTITSVYEDTNCRECRHTIRLFFPFSPSTCAGVDCNRKIYCKGLCRTHYDYLQKDRWPIDKVLNYRILEPGERSAYFDDVIFLLEAGENPVKISERLGKSLMAISQLAYRRDKPEIGRLFDREAKKQKRAVDAVMRS